MLRNPNAAKNLEAQLIKRKIAKVERLLTTNKRWRNEMPLTEDDIEAYIERMKDAVPNDTKVTNCLLKWLELKKKYQTAQNPLIEEIE